MNRSVEDPPLPIGFYENPNRRCVFALEKASSGYKGLCLAVLLRAVEEGCNPEWLKLIAKFYEIDTPEGMLDKTPNRRLKMDPRKGDFNFNTIETTDRVRAPLLDWEDGLHASSRLG